MMTGNIHHIDPKLYDCPGFRQALTYLAALEAFPPVGQADIDGEEVFASVQSYDTKPHADIPWECHREYIDIQFVYSGKEKVGVAPVAGIPGFDYDQANDIAFTQDNRCIAFDCGFSKCGKSVEFCHLSDNAIFQDMALSTSL